MALELLVKQGTSVVTVDQSRKRHPRLGCDGCGCAAAAAKYQRDLRAEYSQQSLGIPHCDKVRHLFLPLCRPLGGFSSCA